MANPKIEVEIVAKIDGLSGGVSQATSQLDKLGKSAASTAPQFEQLSKSTSRYNSIGLDFARVIQDAPFGIIGVGNNIQQLSQSFSALGNSGDSLGTKLKTAFGQILSSGNLLVLGVSVVTAAWTYYEKSAQKAESASKSLNDQLEKYRENLDGIAKANLEGIKNAQSEIANFKLLQSQAENTNISYEKRIEAVEKLKKQYPDYLKNLTNEQILTGNVGTAYDNLTASIIATAKAKAFQAQIGQNALNQATLAAQVEENLVKIKELQIQKADILAQSEKINARDKQDFLTRAEAIQSNINKLEEENKKNKEETKKLDASNLKLAEEINKKVSEGADFVKDTGKEVDANKEKLKQYSQAWDDYNLQQETANFLADKYNLTQKDLEKNIRSVLTAIPKEPIRIVSDDEALQAYNDELFKTQQAAYKASLELMRSSDTAYAFSDNLGKLSGKEVKINLKVDGLPNEDSAPLPFIQQLETALNPKKFTQFEERISSFAFNVRDLLQNNLTNAFVDLGYTIGESLATGANVIQEVGKSLLKSFGRFLGQFGEQLIAYGVATIAFGKASIGLSNPFTAIPSGGLAIAAGVALTAISGVIGALGKKGPGGVGGGGGGGAGGGSAATGTSFTGGAQGGLFAQNRDLNGELVVRGQDLVYVFNQANNKITKG